MRRERERHRIWREHAAGLGVALVSLALGACQSDDAKAPAKTKPTAEQDPATGATLPEAAPLAISVAANDETRSSPFDATPSPDGKDVYYTALSVSPEGDKLPGLYRVSANGGAVETLTSGDPLAAPVGITITAKGTTLLVADPGADGGGAILAAPTGGGAASPLAGTVGYRPQGLTVATVKGVEKLYFTGTDPASGDRGLFAAGIDGGGVTVVASGDPFSEPGGVAVARNGDAFVADALAADGLSAIIQVVKGKATPLVERIGTGFPAGITLTEDESELVVSGLDPATRSDIVYFVKIASGEMSALTETISAFHEPAGLHRAHDANVFAWADSRANETGTVYVLRP